MKSSDSIESNYQNCTSKSSKLNPMSKNDIIVINAVRHEDDKKQSESIQSRQTTYDEHFASKTNGKITRKFKFTLMI